MTYTELKDWFLEIKDPYGTHRTLLWKALEATSGRVLELGVGNESTPYLHEYCKLKGRDLESWDDDSQWISKFLRLKTDQHKIYWTDDWDRTLPVKLHWSVILIDHTQSPMRRNIEAKRLHKSADLFVIHDTESDTSDHRWPEIWPLFKYRINDYSVVPGTSLVSNTIDVSKWNG